MSEYLNIYISQLKKLTELFEKKREIEAEIVNVKQMLRATYNLVPAAEKKSFANLMNSATQFFQEAEKGLTEAIRTILQNSPKDWFSPTQVRDRLQESGFNFTSYASNPLSSIHSVLKRFKRNEVKVRELLDGTKKYRWIKRRPSLKSVYGLDSLPAMTKTVSLARSMGGADDDKEKK